MNNYSDINKKLYSDLAAEYDKSFEKYKEIDQILLKPFIDILKTKNKELELLEIGPGVGSGLYVFEKNKIKTWAIEISPEIIKIAKKNSPNTNFIKGDFSTFDFKGKKFDAVFAMALIHLFPQEEALKVIAKMGSLLKEGGIVYITTTVNERFKDGFKGNWVEEELIKEINKMGFKILDKYYNIGEDKKKKWVNLVLSLK